MTCVEKVIRDRTELPPLLDSAVAAALVFLSFSDDLVVLMMCL
jgi:hypothetical protein